MRQVDTTFSDNFVSQTVYHSRSSKNQGNFDRRNVLDLQAIMIIRMSYLPDNWFAN